MPAGLSPLTPRRTLWTQRPATGTHPTVPRTCGAHNGRIVGEDGALSRLWALSPDFEPSHDRFVEWSSIASELHSGGSHLAAGYAWGRAVFIAWESPTEFAAALTAAAGEYLEAVAESPACSIEGLAALTRLAGLFGQASMLRDGADLIPSPRSAVIDEIANRVLSCDGLVSGGCEHLVRGLSLKTDLGGQFELRVPSWEVEWGSETSGGGFVSFSIPSPFQLFIQAADYEGANRTAAACPEAFTTPGLRGWRHAVLGFVDRASSVEHFLDAAAEFALDVAVPGGPDPERGHWSSINVDLWARYFRARSDLALAVREPARAGEHIERAAEALPLGASGWIDPGVHRFRAVLACLARLTNSSADAPIDAIRREFELAARFGEPMVSDDLALQFIDLTSAALEGFAADPVEEITRGHLSQALTLLDRLPLMEPGITDAVRRAAGASATATILGSTTWVHAAIESIADERQLHRLILRLARVAVPAYAQILHGPLEHGKDVVVLVKAGATTELRMYQAKVGEMSTSVWRNAKQELEAMFEVPVPNLLTEFVSPDSIVGYLVTNRHPGPYVVSEMEGWFTQQRTVFGRDIRLMHIDGLVSYIFENRLINEFRSFCHDEGLE
jgi:hypothetical protein